MIWRMGISRGKLKGAMIATGPVVVRLVSIQCQGKMRRMRLSVIGDWNHSKRTAP